MKNRRRPSDSVLVTILAGFGMIGPFSTDTIFPAFAAMQVELSASEAQLQWLVSTYMISFAVFSLFHGPLSDARGRRPIMFIGLSIYLAASIGCALAPTLTVLMVMRAFPGLGAGASQIIGRALVRDYYAGEDAQRIMAVIATIFGIAPALAPIIGGLIVGSSNWRMVFWFLAIVAVLMMLGVAVLPEPLGPDDRVPFSGRELFESVAHVVASRPGLELAILGGLHFAAVFLYISGAPLFVGGLLHGGVNDYWKLFVPIVIGMMAGSWVSSRLASWTPQRLARLGYTIGLCGFLINLAFNLLPATAGGLPWAIVAIPVGTFGMSLVFPMIQLAMLELFPGHRGAAASVQGFFSLIIGALNAGFLAPAVGGSLVGMAATSVVLFACAAMLWRHYARTFLTGA